MLTDREELLEDLKVIGRLDICEALTRGESKSLDVDSKRVLQKAADEVRSKRKLSSALIREALVVVSTSGWGGGEETTIPGQFSSVDRH